MSKPIYECSKCGTRIAIPKLAFFLLGDNVKCPFDGEIMKQVSGGIVLKREVKHNERSS